MPSLIERRRAQTEAVAFERVLLEQRQRRAAQDVAEAVAGAQLVERGVEPVLAIGAAAGRAGLAGLRAIAVRVTEELHLALAAAT